ncbi:hypothetical protein R3P38DRAFT_2531889 [Favolaschia claudopus]|uniref:Uncharacterized protein n=1 Tax=Favolaschia claudopus TaxID=2862362 RepID=A0AAW0BAL8_9AGAR
MELVHQIGLLKAQLAEACKNHQAMVNELVVETDVLKYRLTAASVHHEDTRDRLSKLQHQLFDLQQLVLRIRTRLISWVKREINEDMAEEVAETQRFIGTVGGQLWDGAKETVREHRRRRACSDSE